MTASEVEPDKSFEEWWGLQDIRQMSTEILVEAFKEVARKAYHAGYWRYWRNSEDCE